MKKFKSFFFIEYYWLFYLSQWERETWWFTTTFQLFDYLGKIIRIKALDNQMLKSWISIWKNYLIIKFENNYGKNEYYRSNLYGWMAKKAFLKLIYPHRYLLKVTGNSL